MATKEILLLGNPVLRKRCKRVDNLSHPVVKRTIRNLADTLNNFRKSHGFGRGIAASQIGVTMRIIVANIDEPAVIINPKITYHSKTMMTLWDDCFSFPGILVKVKRHSNITVAYIDEHGKKKQIHAAGELSELLQHEIDHLDGILAIDRAIDSRHIILRSEYEKMTPAKKNFQTL